MLICLCNPFSDKKVKEHLDQAKGTCTVSQVYSYCSSGKKPNCGSCIEALTEMINAHNASV